MTDGAAGEREELLRVSRLLAEPPADEGVIAASALGPLRSDVFAALANGSAGRRRLLRRTEWAARVLDADLTSPAPWIGPDRHALHRRGSTNSAWLPVAFDVVGEHAAGGDRLGFDDLIAWNDAVGEGGRVRERAMRVDGVPVPFSAERSVELAAANLEVAQRDDLPPALVAAGVHLGLLLAHPFADGNGKVARMVAAWVLLRSGHRSSLVTNVEQHQHHCPVRYGPILRRLRRREITADAVIDVMLGAQAARTVPAAWIRQTLRDPPEPFERIAPRVRPDVATEVRSQLARVAGDLARVGAECADR